MGTWTDYSEPDDQRLFWNSNDFLKQEYGQIERNDNLMLALVRLSGCLYPMIVRTGTLPFSNDMCPPSRTVDSSAGAV